MWLGFAWSVLVQSDSNASSRPDGDIVWLYERRTSKDLDVKFFHYPKCSCWLSRVWVILAPRTTSKGEWPVAWRADWELDTTERPEDLFQRLVAFVEESLLGSICYLTHHNEQITENVKLSLTLKNFVVFSWQCLINAALPKFVKQRYGTSAPELSLLLSQKYHKRSTHCSTKLHLITIQDKPW